MRCHLFGARRGLTAVHSSPSSARRACVRPLTHGILVEEGLAGFHFERVSSLCDGLIGAPIVRHCGTYAFRWLVALRFHTAACRLAALSARPCRQCWRRTRTCFPLIVAKSRHHRPRQQSKLERNSHHQECEVILKIGGAAQSDRGAKKNMSENEFKERSARLSLKWKAAQAQANVLALGLVHSRWTTGMKGLHRSAIASCEQWQTPQWLPMYSA